MRRTSRTAVLLLALAAAPAQAETLNEQVNRAIERGIAAVRRSIGDDGAGTTGDHENYPEGDTALLLFTLLKSGVPADDPQVRRAAEWLRDKHPAKTYSAALCVLALDALKDPQFDAQIRTTAEWIEQRMNPREHRWGYPDGETDLSNTQYAALALWTAERHKFKAKPEVWNAVLTGVLELQKKDGGFGYRSYYDETGAMTVAAMAVIELATPRLPEREHERRVAETKTRAKEAMDRAWAWLDVRFAVDGNPHGPHGKSRDWTEYYLYGIERLASIAKRDRIAGRDWYDEGARQLVATQRDDGAWRDPHDTCFALLFLRRATLTAMDDTARPGVAGDGVVHVKPPTKPRSDVRWIRRWLVLGPVADPADELFDKPPFPLEAAAPTAGSVSADVKWRAVESRERWTRFPDREHPVEHSQSWTFAYLVASADCDAVLWFGHDDGLRCLLDGAEVFAQHFHDGFDEDTHPVAARIVKGAHRLLCQVENWGGATHLCLRIAHPDGSPCTEIRPSLVADGADLEESAHAQPGFFELDELRKLLPKDPRLNITFASEDHLDRLALDGDRAAAFPCWRARPEDAPSQVNPGATGVLGLHPEEPDRPATAYWRVQLPPRRSTLRVRASCSAYDPGQSDGLLRLGVFDGKLKWVLSEVVGPVKKAAAANWKWFEADLEPWTGKDVVILLQAADGGTRSWYAEDVWIDEVEIVRGK